MPKFSGLLVRAIVAMLLGAASLALYSARTDIKPYVSGLLSGERTWFADEQPPISSLPHIFDLGIVDANGDGHLDVYTSNHNYRQALLIASPEGGYHDVLSEWMLDQSRDFPGCEQSFTAPVASEPGLYIYWLGESLTLRAHGLDATKPVSGTLRMLSRIGIERNNNFLVTQKTLEQNNSMPPLTTVGFSVQGDGVLVLAPFSRGVPSEFEIAPGLAPSSIFVGNQKISPAHASFSPLLRDRHGLAWADINADGHLDVYISRGAVGGTLRKMPSDLRQRIRDELFISRSESHFTDKVQELGIEKKDCSGRHVEWVDFDGDGRLDLFVNCQDRGKSKGPFPKQLWRQGPDGRFQDVAVAVGLGLVDRELIDFVWMDVDGDGDVDLLTNEDRGFFLYRHNGERFEMEPVYRPNFVRAEVPELKGEVNNYWRFDGKLTVIDFDADGDLDVFASSKRGNALLVNDNGHFRYVDPASKGLPRRSLNAIWVDYDNDGRPDLYTVPDGLFHQTAEGRFKETGMLELTPNRYQAAIAHWYDRDNDGRRDLLVALNENPGLWRWWQKPFRTEDDIHNWKLHAKHNRGPAGNWLQIAVNGPTGNRQAIGARVSVVTPEGIQTQEVGLSDSAFFSQGHYRLYYGLGGRTRADKIAVRWSDGRSRVLTDIEANRLLAVDYPRSSEQESQ